MKPVEKTEITPDSETVDSKPQRTMESRVPMARIETGSENEGKLMIQNSSGLEEVNDSKDLLNANEVTERTNENKSEVDNNVEDLTTLSPES